MMAANRRKTCLNQLLTAAGDERGKQDDHMVGADAEPRDGDINLPMMEPCIFPSRCMAKLETNRSNKQQTFQWIEQAGKKQH